MAVTVRLKARLTAVKMPYVVAADGGAATAVALGFSPNVVVGDFDSLARDTRAFLAGAGASFEPHPRDKDHTDGALAATRALAEGCWPLVLVGYLGGPRLDQALANVLLLGQLPVGAVLLDGQNECLLLRGRDEHAWQAEAGEIVSLLPLGADVHGVQTEGLRWALTNATLPAGHTRGVSNEPVAHRVRVRVRSGALLVTRHFPATG